MPVKSSIEIPVSELNEGVYIVRISNGQDNQTLKFVKY